MWERNIILIVAVFTICFFLTGCKGADYKKAVELQKAAEPLRYSQTWMMPKAEIHILAPLMEVFFHLDRIPSSEPALSELPIS